MALTMRVESDGYAYQEPILYLTAEVIQASREKFELFRERGTIQAEDYGADLWYITDEVHKAVALRLAIDEIAFARDAQPYLRCGAELFGQAFRVIVTSGLGRSISGMQNLVNTIRNYVCRDGLDASKVADIAANGPDLINLLILLPGENPEKFRLIDDLQDYLEASEGKRRSGEQRTLAYYQTYFRFDAILQDFWQTASQEEKLLYFPVYLWWRITMIIPLRPTEFVLTPRNCIVEKEGKTIVLLRRTKLKGMTQAVSYKISEDYEIKEYNIPGDLAEEISWYREKTAEVYSSDIDTLFCKATQFDIAGVLRDDDHHYTYANLGQCLARYYRDILVGRYNLTIVPDKRNPLNEGEIGRISLGDTRHMALINLVMSGASLQACKELAGHHHIVTASHYYSNITSMLDALSLTQQYRLPVGNQTRQMLLRDVSEGIPINHNDGLCFSPRMEKHDYSDCVCACDQYGYPGTCDCCQYYLPHSAAKGRQICEHAKAPLRYTCVLLEQALDQYRKGIGKEETIRSVIEKLRTDALTYASKSVIDNKRGGYYG